MAGHKVGVEMSEEDVADPEAEFFSIGEVLLDIALRVDYDAGRTGLVTEQIGSVGQAAQIILFQDHRTLHCLPANRSCTNQFGSPGLRNPYSQVPASPLTMVAIIT